MSDETTREPRPLGPPSSTTSPSSNVVLEEAGRQIRAPWAASIAGLLFAALFTGSLLFMRFQPTIGASDKELAGIYAMGEDLAAFVGGLYLAPFAGIMFLWFMAVVRDQIGKREDQFFATVFLGSGLVFVAMYFAAIAVASAPVVGVRYLGLGPPSSDEVELFQQVSYSLMFGFATRAAAVFLMAMATIGLRSGVFPRWFSRVGYAVAILLLVMVAYWDWVVLVFPAWIALVSGYILRREWRRARAA
jgi:hypothetical protein